MSNRDLWIEAEDQDPSEPGIYPVQISYDMDEGMFPNAGEWNGSQWEGRAGVVFWINQKCETRAEADDIAHDKDCF